jgi:hypothetical protein
MYIDEEGKEKQRKERKGKGGEQRYMTVYDTQIITIIRFFTNVHASTKQQLFITYLFQYHFVEIN